MSEIFNSLAGQRDLPRWFSRVYAVLERITVGRIDIVIPDGRIFRVDSGVTGPHAVMQVKDGGIFSRIIREGQMAFCEAYMDGQWDTPDLQALLDILLLSNDNVGHEMPGFAIVRGYERLRHWLRSNSKSQARKNISYHYDLGNSFYEQWLDETMTYSSALFDETTQDISTAQSKKYENLCNVIGVNDGDHLLEIGCGWGGFAEHAAKTRGARITGLTISQEQHDFAKKRLFHAGLNERVDIVMRDYRDEAGRYDGIASIEMFEAVGEKYWPQYFRTLSDRLNPGATAGLQIITVSDHLFESYRHGVDFIQKYIFPGGMLPSATALRDQLGKAGLAETSWVAFGDSYSRTLRRWHSEFNSAWPSLF